MKRLDKPEVILTAVRQHQPKRLSTRERAIEEARRKHSKPFDYERYKAEHPEPGFESDEELEAFLDDVYRYRRKYST